MSGTVGPNQLRVREVPAEVDPPAAEEPPPGAAEEAAARRWRPPADEGRIASDLIEERVRLALGRLPAEQPPRVEEPADLSAWVGSPDYYRRRCEDFKRRHPDLEPPAYYLGYGDKYAHRFLEETLPRLSPAGQDWLKKTLTLLQRKMEDKRREDPAAFEQLERDPEAFLRFAYDTHPDAYLEGGLRRLSPSDLLVVAATPDLKDLLTPIGVKQAIETGARLTVQWAEDAAEKGIEWGRRGLDRVADATRDAARKVGDGARRVVGWIFD